MLEVRNVIIVTCHHVMHYCIHGGITLFINGITLFILPWNFEISTQGWVLHT